MFELIFVNTRVKRSHNLTGSQLIEIYMQRVMDIDSSNNTYITADDAMLVVFEVDELATQIHDSFFIVILISINIERMLKDTDFIDFNLELKIGYVICRFDRECLADVIAFIILCAIVVEAGLFLDEVHGSGVDSALLALLVDAESEGESSGCVIAEVADEFNMDGDLLVGQDH